MLKVQLVELRRVHYKTLFNNFQGVGAVSRFSIIHVSVNASLQYLLHCAFSPDHPNIISIFLISDKRNHKCVQHISSLIMCKLKLVSEMLLDQRIKFRTIRRLFRQRFRKTNSYSVNSGDIVVVNRVLTFKRRVLLFRKVKYFSPINKNCWNLSQLTLIKDESFLF